MTSDLLSLPPIGGRSPQPFAPVKVCPIALAQAIAEGLQLFQEYAAWRDERGMPPSDLPAWHFICAVAPEHLQVAILRWLDDMLDPSPSN